MLSQILMMRPMRELTPENAIQEGDVASSGAVTPGGGDVDDFDAGLHEMVVHWLKDLWAGEHLFSFITMPSAVPASPDLCAGLIDARCLVPKRFDEDMGWARSPSDLQLRPTTVDVMLRLASRANPKRDRYFIAESRALRLMQEWKSCWLKRPDAPGLLPGMTPEHETIILPVAPRERQWLLLVLQVVEKTIMVYDFARAYEMDEVIDYCHCIIPFLNALKFR